MYAIFVPARATRGAGARPPPSGGRPQGPRAIERDRMEVHPCIPSCLWVLRSSATIDATPRGHGNEKEKRDAKGGPNAAYVLEQ